MGLLKTLSLHSFKFELKDIFIKIPRNAILLILIFFTFFASAKTQKLIEIERNHENNPHMFGPVWSYTWSYISTISESTNEVEFEFSVNVHCDSSTGFMGWPQVSCEQPYLIFRTRIDDAFIKIGDIRLDVENYRTRYRPYEMGKKVYKEMFLVDDPVLKLTVVGTSRVDMGTAPHEVYIQLGEFRRHAKNYVSTVEQRFSDKNEEDVTSWFLHAAAWIIGVLLSIFLLYKLSKNILPIFMKIRLAWFVLKEKKRNNRFDATVRRAAVDEAIRQLTRREIDEGVYKDKESLMRLIRSALERDDYETAKALSLMLKKDFRSSESEE